MNTHTIIMYWAEKKNAWPLATHLWWALHELLSYVPHSAPPLMARLYDQTDCQLLWARFLAPVGCRFKTSINICIGTAGLGSMVIKCVIFEGHTKL